MLVEDLQPGQRFCVRSRKNATVYTVSSTAVRPVWKIDSGPAWLIGKYLVILDNCKQLTLSFDAFLYDPSERGREL